MGTVLRAIGTPRRFLVSNFNIYNPADSDNDCGDFIHPWEPDRHPDWEPDLEPEDEWRPGWLDAAWDLHENPNYKNDEFNRYGEPF